LINKNDQDERGTKGYTYKDRNPKNEKGKQIVRVKDRKIRLLDKGACGGLIELHLRQMVKPGGGVGVNADQPPDREEEEENDPEIGRLNK